MRNSRSASTPDAELIRRGLQLCKPLDAWPIQSIDKLAKASRLAKYNKGRVIMPAGSQKRDVLVVVSGCVEVGGVGAEGTRFMLAMHGPGSIVAVARLLPHTQFVYEFRAYEDTLVIWFSAAALEQVLNDEPMLWRDLCLLALDRMHGQIKQTKRRALSHLPARLADTLLSLSLRHSHPQGKDMNNKELRVSQHDLAAMLAVSRQSINKALRELEHKGVIDSGYCTLRICDLPLLREMASSY